MKKCYIVSNERCFFFRFTNSAFGSKWCGLWFPPKKVVEYFAFNINGEWLSENNFRGFELKNGIAEHRYALNGLSVTEQLFVPEHRQGLVDVLTIKNLKGARDVVVSCKPGFNIRTISDNAHQRDYSVMGPTPILVSNELGGLAFGSTADYGFIKEENYRTHTPGNYISDWGWRDEVEQSVFEPGILGFRIRLRKGQSRAIPFIFSNKRDFKYLCNYKKFVPEPRMEHYSRNDLKGLANTVMAFYNTSNIGSGFFAGYPWFQHYWGRDSAFAIMASTNLGHFDGSRRALRTLARYESNGRIPNLINLDGTASYKSADASPLFIVALDHYVRHSKDFSLMNDMENVVRKLLDYQISKITNGLIYSKAGESWMDTLEREGFCIEIQSFWAEAFLRAAEMYDKSYIKHSKVLLDALNSRFWRNGFFDDVLEGSVRSSNVLFPLFFGHIEQKKAGVALSILESESFTTERGVRTTSKYDPSYNPGSYHTGNIWGLLTALMCGAELKYNRVAEGKRYLDIILKNTGLRCIDGVDEVYHGDSGWPSGCVSQAWSVAPVISAIDESVLGIEPDMKNNILFNPSGGVNVTRNIRIGNDKISVKCDKNEFTISGIKENNLKPRTRFKLKVI